MPFRGGDHLVADQDPAGIRSIESRDLAQQRRLAAARRSENGEELPIGDLERHVRQRREVAVPLAEALERQSRHGSTPFGSRPARRRVDSINALVTTTVSMPSAAA